MLTIETVPQLFKIISKIDAKPVIEKLKNIDVWDDTKTDDDGNPVRELDREKVGVLGFEILAEITPQLGKIGGDIPELIAAYKSIPVEEAKRLDFAEVINELINDEGIVNFFKRALAKKVAPE